jgi:hypothetical protein
MIGREAGFAFLAWAIPFAVSVCLSGLKSSHLPLFDTLMGVVVSTSTVLLGTAYLRRRQDRFIAHGLRIGITWAAANLWPTVDGGTDSGWFSSQRWP